MAGIASFLTPCSSLNLKPLPYSFHLNPTTRRPFHHLTITKAQGDNNNSNSSSSATSNDQPLFVTAQDVPLEGVIQFDKPTSSSSSSRIQKWGRVALLAGVDVLALLVFATIGRYSHGLSTMDLQTLRTADPFIAGWFLGAYFLGGYGEDGRGMKGLPSGVIATAKSWAVGIPIGIAIRTATSGNLPNYGFIFVSLGSTAVLLITFRALLYTLLPLQNQNKADDDVYRRGSPFELFELLTSLVRRW
ncbi:uncharacterized protein LOC107495879 [Arachis duranensis]|uniref:Uncharacterized protein LOC107495879 n=1 Tax=Arachis duranensis TaxID=130453 RepID=A0A6P4DRD5_ARADU|nr:uncharacterized protein LOC107495879 [Arachis duranensis]